MSNSNNSQVLTCKAAVCWGDGEEPKLEEIQVDPPKSSEVRLKILYASFCHTDVLCSHGFPSPSYPRVLGHEGVGVVESIGDEVKDLKVGDFVIPFYVGECEECENCKSGKTNFCLKYPISFTGLMADGTSRMSVKGKKLYHIFSCSTWTEYAVIHAKYVLKVDTSVDLAYASFLSCGYTTGYGTTWKIANVVEGSTVAVFGLGAVGLGAVEAARINGASKIVGVDKNERKKEAAQVFGMTHFINPDESEKSISELIKDLTGGLGVDYSIECTGVPPLINEALLATRPGTGETIIVGVTTEANVTINFLPLLCGGTLKGCIFGGIKIRSDIPILLDKCKTRELHLDTLLTHEMSLENIKDAFQLVKQPDCIKILIKIQ